MAKNAKMSVEMRELVMAAMGKVEADAQAQKISRKYSALTQKLDVEMQENREKQRKLAFRNDLTISEVNAQAQALKAEHENKFEQRAVLVEKCRAERAPYVKESQAYTKAFCALDNLYDAYVLAIKQGTWGAVGGFKTERVAKNSKGEEVLKVSVHNVPDSFADVLVKLGTEHGMKFNNKSEITFPESICTRMGATVRKGELAALGKNAFVKLFCVCVLQYAIEAGQL